MDILHKDRTHRWEPPKFHDNLWWLNKNQPSTTSLEEARYEIEDVIYEHFDTGRRGMLCVTGTPGVGKTKTANQISVAVADREGRILNWFVKRHNQIDELSLLRNGRPLLHVQKRGEENCNCELLPLVHTVGKKGWSVADLVCSPKPGGKGPRPCKVPRKMCPWWSQFEGDSDRAMAVQYLGFPKLWYRKQKPQDLIFDEVDARDFCPQPARFRLDTIGWWIGTWPAWTDVLSKLLSFVGESRKEYLADSDLYEELDEILPALPKEVNLPMPKNEDLSSWPDSRLGAFLKILARELKWHRGGKQFVSRVAVHNREIVFYPEAKLPKELFGHPGLLLNATADVKAIKHLLERKGYPVTVYAPNVASQAGTTVTQVLDANHSNTALERSEAYRQRWVERIKAHLGGLTVIMVQKIKWRKYLEEKLSDPISSGQVAVDYYGNVSGLNAYEHFDTCILAQPFNPNPVDVADLYRRVYGGEPGPPLDLSICWREDFMLTSYCKGWRLTVATMRDERLASLYEHLRWSEMYQAAHRVRPIEKPRNIVILCAVPVPGLEPDLVTYNPPARPVDKLVEAAKRVLERKEAATEQDIADEARVHRSTVNRHWNELAESLIEQFPNVHETKVLVSTSRYPNGRKRRALTSVAKSNNE